MRAYYARDLSYFDVVLCISSSQILATPSMLARFARSGSQSHPPLKKSQMRHFVSK